MKRTHKKTAIPLSEAENIINSLAILIKTAGMHTLDNDATKNAMERIMERFNPLLAKESIALQLTDDNFYLNDRRIRFTLGHSDNFDFIIKTFKALQLSGITFIDSLREDDLTVFLKALSESDQSETPFETFEKGIEQIQNIEIEKLVGTRKNIPKQEKRRLVKKSYSNAISIVRSAFEKFAANEKVKFARSKRAIEKIIEQIADEECLSYLLAMTTIKDYDDYTFYHSVNVSILSMALGHQLELPRVVLTDLGLAALFHDIGKLDMPSETLNKTDELTDEDWETIKQHPLKGMIKLIQIKGISEASMDLAIPAFEHHINYDMSGYPGYRSQIDLELFSKIISIADHYDAMTSARVYSRTPKAPDKALSIMLQSGKSEMDPTLLKYFVRMIGKYPVGCLVLLDSNELAIVAMNNPNTAFVNRPRVLVITDSSGARVEGTVFDLTEKDEEGNYMKSISKTLDPNKYAMNLSEYLLLTS